MQYRIAKGMSDIYSPDIYTWQFIEQEARYFFGSRLYEEIRTPIVEYTELFTRSIGEASDIVNKEMYSFRDRGDRSLTLRPEMTASIVRSVIENNLLAKREPLKLFYIGPMFRAERPQAGRKRQFYQIGVEVIGNDDPFCDAEVIKDSCFYLQRLGLEREEYTVKLNNIGCQQCRPPYMKRLKEYFITRKEQLCADCNFKFDRNVLRIFDCKNDTCRTIAQDAPKIGDNVCQQCRDHFGSVEKVLQSFGISYQIDNEIVRGLDYYTSTVFEITSNKLGAKDAIAAGGRYNNLFEELGGTRKGAIGFAIGVERLLMCLENKLENYKPNTLQKTVYIAYSDSKYLDDCKMACVRLETFGLPTYADWDEKRSLKSQLKRANKFGLRWVLIFNKDEVERGQCTLKDFCYKGQDQCRINIKNLEKEVSSWIEEGLKKRS